jgi:hypothetical protein
VREPHAACESLGTDRPLWAREHSGGCGNASPRAIRARAVVRRQGRGLDQCSGMTPSAEDAAAKPRQAAVAATAPKSKSERLITGPLTHQHPLEVPMLAGW